MTTRLTMYSGARRTQSSSISRPIPVPHSNKGSNPSYSSPSISIKSARINSKWYPIPFIVHYFCPRPIGLWSKVVLYIGNRVPFGTQALLWQRAAGGPLCWMPHLVIIGMLPVVDDAIHKLFHLPQTMRDRVSAKWLLGTISLVIYMTTSFHQFIG